ncbi:hypothetical protein ACFFLS_08750 [Flavobacterium procerum]|uniref:DUF2306 domain-containing protein n=1 Tax=Flavobacterium procerum TaxID=1455569 RepID=A0ABV6BQ75_9FLAO
METTIKTIIYIHAFFGGIGLISGIGSIVAKKGSPLHKKMGKLFSVGMLVSSLLSLPICLMPKHQNIFSFLVGLFTIYLVISGNRFLSFKNKTKADFTDKLISGSMLFCSVIMVALGIYCQLKGIQNGILFTFFGGFGLYMTVKDFLFFKNVSAGNTKWLSKHIGKMSGALIASITAFIVAGMGLGNITAWMLPSVIGTFYIIYWNRKIEPKKRLSEV